MYIQVSLHKSAAWTTSAELGFPRNVKVSRKSPFFAVRLNHGHYQQFLIWTPRWMIPRSMCVCACTYIHTQTSTHKPNMHMHTHVWTHIFTHTYIHAHIQIQPHVYTCRYTGMHTCAYTHTYNLARQTVMRQLLAKTVIVLVKWCPLRSCPTGQIFFCFFMCSFIHFINSMFYVLHIVLVTEDRV